MQINLSNPVQIQTYQVVGFITLFYKIEEELQRMSFNTIWTILLNWRQLFVQTHADVLGLSLILPNETESVLLGAAMLGAAASEKVEEDRETGLVSYS